jgi:ABC-2 type transport system permease protein
VLWYKSWLETKPRFLTCLATLTLFCTVFVHHFLSIIDNPALTQIRRPERASDLNRLLFVNQQYLVIMWILSVVLLGMGGIVREKALGTSSLTLALPVSRIRLLAVRIGVDSLEAVVLGVLPWGAIVVVMLLRRLPISFSQVASYVLLLVAGGLVYLAMAILVSSVVPGEYTAPAVAFGIVLLVAIISEAWFREYSVWRLITGDLSVNRSTYLLPQHLPWSGILASLFVALLMMVAAIIVLQRRDF